MCLCSKIKGPHKQIKLTMIKKKCFGVCMQAQDTFKCLRRICAPSLHSTREINTFCRWVALA